MKVKIKIPDNATIIYTNGIRKLKEEKTTTFIGTTDDIDECVILIRKQIHTAMFKPITIFDIIYPEPLEKPKKYVPEPEGGPMPEDEEDEEEIKDDEEEIKDDEEVKKEEQKEEEEEEDWQPEECPICKNDEMCQLNDGRFECSRCGNALTKEQIESWEGHDVL